MPFLTQGKTNWKLFLIIIILVVIFGGGALLYQHFTAEELIYPGAVVISVPQEVKEYFQEILYPEIEIIMYVSDDSHERVENWYESQLIKEGWEKTTEMNGDIIWTKGETWLGYMIVVAGEYDVETFGVEPGQTIISIVKGDFDLFFNTIPVYPDAVEVTASSEVQELFSERLSPNAKVTKYVSEDRATTIEYWYEMQLTNRGWEAIKDERGWELLWKKGEIGLTIIVNEYERLNEDKTIKLDKIEIYHIEDRFEIWKEALDDL